MLEIYAPKCHQLRIRNSNAHLFPLRGDFSSLRKLHLGTYRPVQIFEATDPSCLPKLKSLEVTAYPYDNSDSSGDSELSGSEISDEAGNSVVRGRLDVCLTLLDLSQLEELRTVFAGTIVLQCLQSASNLKKLYWSRVDYDGRTINIPNSLHSLHLDSVDLPSLSQGSRLSSVCHLLLDLKAEETPLTALCHSIREMKFLNLQTLRLLGRDEVPVSRDTLYQVLSSLPKLQGLRLYTIGEEGARALLEYVASSTLCALTQLVLDSLWEDEDDEDDDGRSSPLEVISDFLLKLHALVQPLSANSLRVFIHHPRNDHETFDKLSRRFVLFEKEWSESMLMMGLRLQDWSIAL